MLLVLLPSPPLPVASDRSGGSKPPPPAEFLLVVAPPPRLGGRRGGRTEFSQICFAFSFDAVDRGLPAPPRAAGPPPVPVLVVP